MKKFTLMIAALALLACGDGVFFAGARGADQSASIVRGGTLIAGKTAKWSTLNPTKTNARADDRYIMGQMYESLLDVDETGALIPRLAESWDVVDAVTIDLKLRRDVAFHDKTKFNAEAAKFVLDWYRDSDTGHVFASEMADLESVDVTGEFSIRLRLKQPSASLLYSLADVCGYMISPDAIKRYGADLARTAVGTGPFQLKEAVEGDHITLTRNPAYYENGADGKPLPYLDEVIVRIIADDTVKTTNLRSGEIHLIDFNNSAISTQTLSKAPGIVTIPTQAADLYAITFNLDDPALSNLKVRQALSHAVNREQLSQIMAEGFAKPASFAASGKQWYHSDIGAYAFDPAKAKALLAEAGYPNGLSLTLSNISREPDNTFVQLLQAQLAQSGFSIKLDTLERLAWVNLFGTQHGGQLGVCKYNIPRADAFIQYAQTLYWLNPAHTGEFKTLLDKTKGTYDQAERLQLLHNYQKAFLGDAMNVFLYQNPRYCSYSDKVMGLSLRVDASWKFVEVWLNP